jgi:hypothetical protein
VIGGNRSGKSQWAAERVMKLLSTRENAIVWCFSESHETSVRKSGQQEYVWNYFPPEWKALNGKRSRKFAVAYTEKNRFAENSCITPLGGECRFCNYTQDPKIIEGGQIDLFWADELIPLEWLVTLRGRLIDRNGKGITTFTPIYGYNNTVGEFTTGGTVEEWTHCELYPDLKHWPGGAPGKVPYIMRCLDPQSGVIYFQPKWNPFISYQRLVDTWKVRSSKDALIRLHGVTQKTSGSLFPRFASHNIIPAAQVPAEGTNYHLVDFAWNRNWFMLWLRVAEHKGKRRVVVYREWPDYKTFGEWVLPSEEPDGSRGPAQQSIGYGPNDYKRLIWTLEGQKASEYTVPILQAPVENRFRKLGGAFEAPTWSFSGGGSGELIYIRYGDPRSGNAKALAAMARRIQASYKSWPNAPTACRQWR